MKLLVLLLACLVLSAQAAPQKRIHKSTLAVEAVLGYTQGRIVGGVDAIPGEFPHIVSVQWILLTASTHICGGSILSPVSY
jgi:prostasin